MIMTGIFILWSCIQNTVGIRAGFFELIGWLLILFSHRVLDALPCFEYDFDLEHKHQMLLKMPSTLQINDLLVNVSYSWLTSKTKRWNLRLTLRPPSLNKTRNTKDVISTCPKQDFLLHTTNQHPPTNK